MNTTQFNEANLPIELDLCIAIPTYNRQLKASKLIKKILEYGKGYSFELLVADNHSDNQLIIEESLSNSRANYIRRRFNIGPTANIMRIFEETEKSWLIIIGDDDDIEVNFFSLIAKSIIQVSSINGSNQVVLAMKYKSSLNFEHNEHVFDGLSSFLKFNSNTKMLGSTLLISTWLFNRSVLTPYVRFSYLYSGLQMPHLIPILMALKEGIGVVSYSNSNPIRYCEPEDNSSWNAALTYSMMLATASVSSIFESKSEFRSFSLGVVGNGIKEVTAFLFRARIFYGKHQYKHILRLVGSLSLKHKLLQIIFPFIFYLIPGYLTSKSLNANAASKSLQRM